MTDSLQEAPRAPWSCILFDLDGTITDSAPGITATLSHTLERMGLPVPAPADLLEFVGPPIMDGFRDVVGLNPEQSAEALGLYRERYQSHGAFDSSVYAGVPQVLEAIHAAGVPLSLATSKPEAQARRILDHFGLDQNFTFIAGASDDEVRSEKTDVIAYALENLRALNIDLSSIVMVGDRKHDVHGAADHDIPTIFVEWGYGSEQEAVGAIAIAHTPAELQTLLLGD